MARGVALAAALAVSLLAVTGARGTATQQTPKRGGTVVVAMNSFAEPTCLGWDVVCQGRWQWRSKVLATPFRPGPGGLRNDLISSYRLSTNPFTVTFRIRPQARWSDGRPLTAEDFTFAHRTYLAHADLLPDDGLRAVRSVRAVDAKTVSYVFGARYGNWQFALNVPPLPRHALRGVDLAASETFWSNGIVNPRTGAAVGSGPFLTGAFERGKQFVLVRNPRYWGSHTAYVDRVVLRFVPGATGATMQALRSGEVDLGVFAESPGALGRIQGFATRTTSWSASQVFEIRVGRGGHRALGDKRVRRAIAYGTDRVALVRELFGDDRYLLDNTIYGRGERAYRANWSIYRYRPARARGLLEQAGCQRGPDGIFTCDEERLRLRFVTTAGVAVRERILQLAASQLRGAGIEVVPVYVPNTVFFGTFLPQGTFDVALFGSAKESPDVALSPYRCGSEENVSGWCSRLTTEDLSQLDRVIQPARRAVVANRVDSRLAAAVPTLPLLQAPLTYAVREGLKGVVPNGYGALTSSWSVWNAEDWWLDD